MINNKALLAKTYPSSINLIKSFIDFYFYLNNKKLVMTMKHQNVNLKKACENKLLLETQETLSLREIREKCTFRS